MVLQDFNLTDEEIYQLKKHYKKCDIDSAISFTTNNSREDFRKYYISHTNKETEENYNIDLNIIRIVRKLYRIDDLPLKKSLSELKPKKPKLGHAANKGKTTYSNGVKNIYLADDEEIPDGFFKGNVRKGCVAYHNSENKVKFFNANATIPDGWMRGEPENYIDRTTNSVKTRQTHIHEFEKENDCLLLNTAKKLYNNGWYSNKDFCSELELIKVGGRNYIKNSDIPKLQNYKGNAVATAEKHVAEFEKEHNCTLLQKLNNEYGQLSILVDLPKITTESGGRVFISNEYLPQIIEYKNSVEPKQSKQEKGVVEYIRSIYNGTIEENNSHIIKNLETNYGLELDAYLPELNIAIEYNGIYWHSSLCGTPKKYHQNKSLLCEEKEIRLIHIYQDEWLYKQDKIKQLLNIALGNIKNRIYARNCEVRQITNKEAKPFSERTHLQGHRNAKVTYGLFYNNELVQLMSFSQTSNARANGAEWEIIRGCPGSNNIVVGGVSKLFTHFIRDYNPQSIFSYCDFNKFDGKSYEALGMKFIGYTGPDKYWIINHRLVPRNPNKYKEYKEKSEGILWGAGSKKYLWVKEE